MKTIRTRLFADRCRAAWLLMVSAIAIHVIDEALTGFLPFYNPTVHSLRHDLGFSFMPTFSFGVWLGGLIFVVIVGFAITPLIGRGGRIIRNVVLALGFLMILNACGHIAGSIYTGRLLPGFWSSPFLLICAVIFVVCRLGRPDRTESTPGDWRPSGPR